METLKPASNALSLSIKRPHYFANRRNNSQICWPHFILTWHFIIFFQLILLVKYFQHVLQ